MFVFYALLPYAYYSFLQWVKFCSGCFRQVFFIWDIKKVVAGHMFDWWSFYTVTILWEFAWADSAVVILDEWLSDRGGFLNRFDFIILGKSSTIASSTIVLGCMTIPYFFFYKFPFSAL